MAEITWVVDTGHPHNDRQVWHKFVQFEGTPAEGDIYLFDEDGGASETVKRRWWQHDGSLLIKLRDMIVDPDETGEQYTGVNGDSSAWWPDQDGDLFALLQASGWERL